MIPVLLAVLMSAPDAVWPASFQEGMSPLNGFGGMPESSFCGGCHHKEFSEWETSRHRVSATNDLFLDGLRQEPHVRCINCHAPTPTPARELVNFLRKPKAFSFTSHDGISCATCHLRNGAVLTAGDSDDSGHPVSKTPFLREAEFCASCHEFSTHETVNGVTTLIDLPMQSTYSEWLQWRQAGGSETCQSCHMPDGAHTFRGAHDTELLKRSLMVEVRPKEIVLSSRGVGHLYPTGDVFRHLRVWAVVKGQRIEVARLERKTALVSQSGRMRQVVVSDTRLAPGVPQRLALPDHTTRVIVTYHMADDHAEIRARVSFDELVKEVLTVDLRR